MLIFVSRMFVPCQQRHNASAGSGSEQRTERAKLSQFSLPFAFLTHQLQAIAVNRKIHHTRLPSEIRQHVIIRQQRRYSSTCAAPTRKIERHNSWLGGVQLEPMINIENTTRQFEKSGRISSTSLKNPATGSGLPAISQQRPCQQPTCIFPPYRAAESSACRQKSGLQISGLARAADLPGDITVDFWRDSPAPVPARFAKLSPVNNVRRRMVAFGAGGGTGGFENQCIPALLTTAKGRKFIAHQVAIQDVITVNALALAGNHTCAASCFPRPAGRSDLYPVRKATLR